MSTAIIAIIIVCLLSLPAMAIVLVLFKMDNEEQRKKARQAYASQGHDKMTPFFEPPGTYDFRPADPYIDDQLGPALLVIKPNLIKLTSLVFISILSGALLLYYNPLLNKYSILGSVLCMLGIAYIFCLRRRLYFFRTALIRQKVFSRQTIYYQEIIDTALNKKAYGIYNQYWTLELILHNGKTLDIPAIQFAKLRAKAEFWRQHFVWRPRKD